MSSSSIGISIEKGLSQNYDKKTIYSSAVASDGDSGDCSSVVFGTDTISIFAPYAYIMYYGFPDKSFTLINITKCKSFLNTAKIIFMQTNR